MKRIIAVTVLALALITSEPRLGMAICLLDVCPPPPPPAAVIGHAASIGAGPWIVGGVMLSALSVIVRAAVVNGRQHRELTSSEAIGAMALPFGWLFWTEAYGDMLLRQAEEGVIYPLGDTAQMSFVVLNEATNDQDKDLASIMAQVKAINHAKQGFRREQDLKNIVNLPGVDNSPGPSIGGLTTPKYLRCPTCQ